MIKDMECVILWPEYLKAVDNAIESIKLTLKPIPPKFNIQEIINDVNSSLVSRKSKAKKDKKEINIDE